MKNFIAGLRYGNWLTRLYLISFPLLIVAGAGGIIYSFFINSMLIFLIGTALAVGGIALAQGFIVELHQEPEETEETEDFPLEDNPDTGKAQDGFPKKVRQKKRKKEKDPAKRKERKTKKNKKQQEENTTEPEIADTPREEPEADEKIKENENLTEEKEERLEKPEEALLAYDEKKIQQVFYKYKVHKEHHPIIIDSWEEKKVWQCPAYIWLHHGQLHMLLMEKTVRELTLPASKASTLTYVRGVVCKAKKEYLSFRKESLLSKVFSPYLPVYHEGTKNGKPVIYKNLFELGEGLRVTGASVKTIMEMLNPDFQVDDIITRDVRYNAFFKEIYRQGILFREQIITIQEYREQIKETLHKLVATGVSEEEYESTLQALYQNKLITEEYISYYMQYWKRIQIENKYSNRRRRRGKQWKDILS